MLIALQSFRGERPRADARELDAFEAQVARNVKLWSGKLRPWLKPRLEQAVVNPGPIKSIYRFADAYWLHWNKDVDVARGPVAGTTRLYWTGDGPPRFGNLESIAGVTTLTAAANAAQNFLLVNDASGFSAGDSITITLDSGSHTTEVTTVQYSLNRLNLAVALPGPAALGNSVVNNNRGYPHGSYLLGVPAPAAAPTAAAEEDANAGTIVAITSTFGEETRREYQTDDKFAELDIEIDSDGNAIEFELYADVRVQIYGLQDAAFTLSVIRDPNTAAEVIFSRTFNETFQGSSASNPQPPSGTPPKQVLWSSLGRFHANLGRGEDNTRFTYTPSEGTHTYRFKIETTLERARIGNLSMQYIYNMRVSARVPDLVRLQLNTADHKLREGDRLQLGGIEGSGSLNVLNGDPVTVLAVDGAFVDVEATAFGEYTGGGTWKQVWEEEDRVERFYVYTYVATLDGKDMEGPPSPPSGMVLVGDNQTVKVSGFIDPRSLGDNRPYRAIYLYRLEVGSETEELQFTAELPLDVTEFSDTLRSTELDEVLPSAEWTPPPENMQGLIELPNGLMAGFAGNELMLCVPYQPHAWPIRYRRTMQDEIVGIAAFGASIFVGTKGRPVIATGVDPEAFSEEHIEVVHPCLSKSGIVDMGYAVLYPTLTGLVLVATGRAEIVTKDLFSDDEWKALNPESFVAAKYGDRYVCFYDNGTERAGFILDPRDARATLTFLDFYASEVWSDPRTDRLYMVVTNAAGEEEIVEWDADQGGIPFTYRWRSKEFVNPHPTSIGVVKVDAELYPVQVNIYADGQVYDSVDVYDENPVRLSDLMGLARKWEIEVVGSTEVEAVYAASSMRELTRYLGGVA